MCARTGMHAGTSGSYPPPAHAWLPPHRSQLDVLCVGLHKAGVLAHGLHNQAAGGRGSTSIQRGRLGALSGLNVRLLFINEYCIAQIEGERDAKPALMHCMKVSALGRRRAVGPHLAKRSSGPTPCKAKQCAHTLQSEAVGPHLAKRSRGPTPCKAK
eukprot:355485-Chlamydomonas_euryale.AAC.5